MAEARRLLAGAAPDLVLVSHPPAGDATRSELEEPSPGGVANLEYLAHPLDRTRLRRLLRDAAAASEARGASSAVSAR